MFKNPLPLNSYSTGITWKDLMECFQIQLTVAGQQTAVKACESTIGVEAALGLKTLAAL
jgi:hypothetical protein